MPTAISMDYGAVKFEQGKRKPFGFRFLCQKWEKSKNKVSESEKYCIFAVIIVKYNLTEILHEMKGKGFGRNN